MNCVNCGNAFVQGDITEFSFGAGSWLPCTENGVRKTGGTCFLALERGPSGITKYLHRHVECPRATLVCAHSIYGENLTKNLGRIGQMFEWHGKQYAVIGVRPNGYIVGYAIRDDGGYDIYVGSDDVLDLKVYDVRLGARGQGVTIKVEAKDAAEAKAKVLQDVEVHVVQPAS